MKLVILRLKSYEKKKVLVRIVTNCAKKEVKIGVRLEITFLWFSHKYNPQKKTFFPGKCQNLIPNHQYVSTSTTKKVFFGDFSMVFPMV